MTRSTNHPDADYSPYDMGRPERFYYTWDDFNDDETNRVLMLEREVF